MPHEPFEIEIRDEIFKQAAELYARYMSDNSSAMWLFSAISNITFLISDSHVKFTNVHISEDVKNDVYIAQVAIFTEDRLITMNAKIGGNDDGHTTQARRRGDLRMIEVALETNPFIGWGTETVVDKICAKLYYAESEKLELTSDRSARFKQHKDLLDFLPSLRADLTASTS